MSSEVEGEQRSPHIWRRLFRVSCALKFYVYLSTNSAHQQRSKPEITYFFLVGRMAAFVIYLNQIKTPTQTHTEVHTLILGAAWHIDGGRDFKV